MIVIKNKVFITEADPKIIDVMQEDLSITNPAFDKAINMNLATWSIPRKLKYYKYDGHTFEAPVGYLNEVKKLLPTHVIKDERTNSNISAFTFVGTLRDYQQKAVDAILSNEMGTVCAPTGSGKTVVMCAAICGRKVNTLVLVNTLELAYQFIDRVKQFIKDAEVGLIGNGKWEVKPITVGILQTITSRDLTELNDYFGAVFCDEVHIIGAETYYEAMSNFKCLHKFGFSATPERLDGLTKVIFFATGPLIFNTSLTDVNKFVIKPTYVSHDTEYEFPLFDVTEYQQMISDLSIDGIRNQLIIDQLKNYPKQQIALLCQRKEQVALLHKHIKDSVVLTSSTPKKKRKEIMEGLRDGSHRIVISTYQLFGTGIDLDTLEVLFMCAPIKSKILIKQVAGRLMRKAHVGKKPIIVDFADKKVELLRYQFYSRSKLLRNL